MLCSVPISAPIGGEEYTLHNKVIMRTLRGPALGIWIEAVQLQHRFFSRTSPVSSWNRYRNAGPFASSPITGLSWMIGDIMSTTVVTRLNRQLPGWGKPWIASVDCIRSSKGCSTSCTQLSSLWGNAVANHFNAYGPRRCPDHYLGLSGDAATCLWELAGMVSTAIA